MCGIFAALHNDTVVQNIHQIIDKIHPWLSRRGHDWICIKHYKIRDTKWSITVIGCVLHLRGELTPQPIESDKNDWLLWNGEAYNEIHTNDTSLMLSRLSSVDRTEDILKVLSDIQGPWSFIYYQEHGRCLWFGRDSLGRRSLVKHIDSNLLIISSIGIEYPSLNFHEVSAIGIYKTIIGLDHIHEDDIACYPWKHQDVNIPFILTMADPDGDPSPTITNIDKHLYLKVPFQQLNRSLPLNNLAPFETADTIHCMKILQLLEESVRRRTIDSWKGPENIGILYSGGLDSVVLAAITDRCLEKDKEIDLINVAFSIDGEYDKAPDRVAAIQSLDELNKERKWNLILVNIDYNELCRYREERIQQLINPLASVMDDSIGCALWFAARGQGTLHGSRSGIPYQSNCKILLVGMGADEQFGGYSRHRTAYVRGGWRSVIDEVNKDICRISTRNLGRDDRCISDHHREARYPYLDEAFVDYMNSLPIWIKTDYTHERGVGEKHLLRQVAFTLGCTQASHLPKRAIQFGSRIAKTTSAGGSGSRTNEQ